MLRSLGTFYWPFCISNFQSEMELMNRASSVNVIMFAVNIQYQKRNKESIVPKWKLSLWCHRRSSRYRHCRQYAMDCQRWSWSRQFCHTWKIATSYIFAVHLDQLLEQKSTLYKFFSSITWNGTQWSKYSRWRGIRIQAKIGVMNGCANIDPVSNVSVSLNDGCMFR